MGSYQYTLDNAGNRLSVTENRYLYTGQQFDATTGQYSLRARYYNPGVGRFMSRDSYPYNFQNPIELNRYGYVAGNPVNFFDPMGTFGLASYTKSTKTAATNTIKFAYAQGRLFWHWMNSNDWGRGFRDGVVGYILGVLTHNFLAGRTDNLFYRGSFTSALVAGIAGMIIGGFNGVLNQAYKANTPTSFIGKAGVKSSMIYMSSVTALSVFAFSNYGDHENQLETQLDLSLEIVGQTIIDFSNVKDVTLASNAAGFITPILSSSFATIFVNTLVTLESMEEN